MNLFGNAIRNLNGTLSLNTGALQVQGNDATGLAGVGLDLSSNGTTGFLQSLNRTSLTYVPLAINGSSISMNYGAGPVQQSGFVLATNGGITLGSPTGGNLGLNTVNAAGLFFTNSSPVGYVASTIRASTTTSRASNATPSNDPNLSYAITASGIYEVEVIGYFGGGGSGGVYFGLNYSGGIGNGGNTAVGVSLGLAPMTGNYGVAIQLLNNVPTSANFFYQPGGTLATSFMTKVQFQATSAGTIGFNWSQYVSNATALLLVAGSSMTVRRVG